MGDINRAIEAHSIQFGLTLTDNTLLNNPLNTPLKITPNFHPAPHSKAHTSPGFISIYNSFPLENFPLLYLVNSIVFNIEGPFGNLSCLFSLTVKCSYHRTSLGVSAFMNLLR